MKKSFLLLLVITGLPVSFGAKAQGLEAKADISKRNSIRNRGFEFPE